MKRYKRRKLKIRNFCKRKNASLIRRKKRAKKEKKKSRIYRIRRGKIQNRILRFLYKKRFFLKLDRQSTTAKIIIPKIFSFTDNPDPTIDILKEIVDAGTNPSIRKIYIDHSNCEDIGLEASTIMDIILIEIENYKATLKNQKSFQLSGKLPTNGPVRNLLEVSGILEHLNFKMPHREKFELLKLIESGGSGLVSEQVIEYIDKCLNSQNQSLNKYGSQCLGQIVGEVIGNCQLHGGHLQKWYTIGHYCTTEKICHLAIFNFGNTIYESLRNPGSNTMIKFFKFMSRKHNSFFSPEIWNEESLWTLLALQDGISRNRNKSNPDRGSGTITLLESFRKIRKSHNENSTLSITSGHINIYIDDKAKIEEKKAGNKNKTRKIVALNEKNDIFLPPNPENVRILRNFFPGTVITMKFFIEPNYIDKCKE